MITQISKDIVARILNGQRSDIPLTVKDLEELDPCMCQLQTGRSEDIDRINFLIHRIKGEDKFYVLNYDSSGKLISYDLLQDWDKDSVMTVHPS